MPSFVRARKTIMVFVLASVVEMASHARADEREKADDQERVDTEFIFGFTAGADVGEVGERELEHQTAAQWEKRDGSYAAGSDQLRFEASPVPDFRFEIGAPVAHYNISGVSGLDDRNQGAFNGVVTEFRYRLFNRDNAGFSLTLGAEPHWSRTDEVSGELVNNYGGELSVALDKELIKNRVFGALNLVYAPETSWSGITGIWERDSTLAFSAAVTTQISSGLFVGAEARFLRKYDGIGLDSLLGQAVFVGPTAFFRLSRSFAISGAWACSGHRPRGSRRRGARSDQFHPPAGDASPRIRFLSRVVHPMSQFKARSRCNAVRGRRSNYRVSVFSDTDE
jgi:hypothetical protein